MKAYNSSFRTDGYRDAMRGDEPSPPDVPVLAAEYWEGYADRKHEEAFFQGPIDADSFMED
jgi:hypothetical protein